MPNIELTSNYEKLFLNFPKKHTDTPKLKIWRMHYMDVLVVDSDFTFRHKKWAIKSSKAQFDSRISKVCFFLLNSWWQDHCFKQCWTFDIDEMLCGLPAEEASNNSGKCLT